MKIDDDIPIPTSGKFRPRREASILAHKLAVGQSIFCETIQQLECAKGAIKRYGGRFASRKQEGGYRIWRVA